MNVKQMNAALAAQLDDESVVIGKGARADKYNGYAVRSVAIGLNAVAGRFSQVVIGDGASASEDYAVAIGVNANGAGQYGVAVGEDASAHEAAVAIGAGAVAQDEGVAIGVRATAVSGSVAIGHDAKADRVDTVSVGGGKWGPPQRQIVNVAAGTQDTDVVNVGQLNGVAKALGGGAGIAADGSVKAPAYTLDGGKTSATNVGEALSNLDGRMTTNATNVEKLQGNFADTGLLDAKTGKVTAAVTSDQMNAAVAKASSDRLDAGRVKIGQDAYATGNNIAVGMGAKADTGGAGTGVIAIGEGAAAGRPGYSGAIAIGYGARAVDGTQGGYLRPVAIGAGAQAQGVSVAIGPDAQSSPGNGVALGHQASVGADATWAVALGTGSSADRADTVSVGNAVSQRQIVNVAAGTQGTDAVNVAQLSGVTTALGGGAGIGADGSVTAPKYHIGDKTYGTVGDALAAAAASGGGGTDSNAVLYDDAAKTSVTLSGEKGATLKNVAAGAVNATSMEAMNGSQLYGASQSVASTLGAGSTVDAEGELTAPTYTLDGGKTAAHNVGEAVSNLDGRVTTNATNVEKLQDNLAESGLFDKDKSQSIAAVTYDRKEDGTADHGSVTLGGAGAAAPVALKNVAMGIGDTDAVNVGQVKGIATALGGGAGIGADGSVTAPKYHVGDKTYGNVGDAITAAAEMGSSTDPNAVAYDDEAKSAVTLAGEKGTTLKNVAAGAVNATSMEAVNGSQLYGTSQSVASALGGSSTVDAAGKLTAPAYTLDGGKTTAHNVGDAVSDLDGRVTTNATNVEKMQDDITESGLVDKDTGKVIAAVTYDRKEDGTADRGSVTLGGAGAAAPVALKNVAMGIGDTDAVNVGQVKGITTALGGGAGIGADGSVTAPKYHVGDKTYGNVGDAITAAAETSGGGGTNPNAVSYDDKTKEAITLSGEKGTTLKNVAAGVAETDAVNVGQLSDATKSIRDSLSDGSLSMRYIKIKATGQAANAMGANTVAIGAGANATGNDSLALGTGSRANGLNSVAIGFNSVATDANQVSVGDIGSERRISNVADGTEDTDAVNVNQLTEAIEKMSARTDKLSSELKSGHSSLMAKVLAAKTDSSSVDPSKFLQVAGAGADGSQENTANIVGGDPSSDTAAAIGVGTIASGANTVAIGVRSYANSDGAVAIGNMAQTGASQPNSVAIGSNVTTNGASALAVGSQAKANGDNAIALGNNNVMAVGEDSIAIGNKAVSAAGTTNGIALGAGANVARSVADSMALGAKTSVEKGANGAVALGTGSKATRANTVSVGNTGTERQIVNVAAGTQGTDAVNVAQLSGVTTALGGGAGIGVDGSVTAPKYHVGDKTYGNVGDAITAAAESGGGGGTNPNAVAYDDATKSTLTLAGEQGTTLKNVAAGAVNATSMEAMNGAQLYGASQSVASALGGGSTVDAAGKLTAPTYTLDGGKNTAHNAGDAFSNLDGRVTTVATNVEKLQGDIADSGLVDKDTGKVIAAVTYDRNDGTVHGSSVTLGGAGAAAPVALKNVADGAVTQASTDALNGSQLYGASQSVASALGGDSTVDAGGTMTAPTYTLDGGKTIAKNVGDAVSNLDGRVTTNATNVEKLQGDIADSGLVDMDTGKVTAAVTYDRKADGTADRGSVTLGGAGAAAPVALKNVAMGIGDTDAANMGQVKGITTALGGGAGIGADGSVTAPKYHVGDKTYGNVGDAITAAAESGGGGGTNPNAVAYDDATKSTLTLYGEKGTTLKNVAAGAVNATSMEAMNGSQLYGTSQSVANALGGGSTVDAAGKLTAPTFHVGNKTYGNVSDAITAAAASGSGGGGKGLSFVTIDGMGSDGSRFNTASITTGDPETTTAAAIGVDAHAAGANAIALGLNTGALSNEAVAIGNMAQTGSDQPFSVAIGSWATTNGAYALAIGSHVRANGENAVAVGSNGIKAIGASSIAIGNAAEASVGATNGIALGTGASVEPNVTDAMALGANTIVDDKANGAVALGAGSKATRANTISVGSAGSERQIVNVAAGTQGTDAVNVAQLSGVTTALGGGAGIGVDGSVTAPKYHVGDKTYGNVGDAITAAAEMGSSTDPNAVAYDDAAKSTITLAGEQGTTLKNVAAGAVNATSMEAVNGSQLYGTSQSVASALGGGATVDAAGKLTAPAYTLDGGKTTVHNVGDAVSDLDGRVTTNATNVEKLKDDITESGLVDKDTGKVIEAVTYDRKEDGTADRGSVTLGGAGAAAPVALKNVAAGAVNATSMEAVNGSQLYGTSQSVASALGGGSTVDAAGKVTAPKYHVGDKTYGNVGDAITAAAETGGGTDPNAVAYDDEAKSAVTLAGEKGTTLKNVAAGAVNATSMEAVNGLQLYGTSQSVASALGGSSTVDAAGKLTAPAYTLDGGKTTAHNVGDAVSDLDGRVTTNATNVEKLQDDITDSGLVDKDTGKVIEVVTYDRKADGTADRGSVTLGGAGAAAPVALKNVAAGVDDTDAVNVGQLNTGLSDMKRELAEGNIDLKYIKVRADGAPATATGAQSVAIGSKALAGGPNSLALGAGARALGNGSVALGSNSIATEPMTVSVGDDGTERKIIHVKAGDVTAKSTDAINGSQLFDALGQLKSRVAAEQSHLLSRVNALADSGEQNSLVVVEGLGGTNTASLSGGDPETTTAAAIGVEAHAAGANAIALGLNTGALSNEAVAIGNMAQTGSDQPFSVAIGSWVTTNGAHALAIGSHAKANGEYAVAVGSNGIKAIGASSIAIGNAAEASVGATNGIALGTGANVEPNVTDAMALGANTIVDDKANGAVALGAGSKATRANTISVGSAGSERQIVNVAAGTQGTDAVNVAQLSGVATALGGGAGIGADGSVTAPKYHVGDKTYGNVGDAIAAAAESGGGGGTDANAVAYDDATKSTITLSGEKGSTLKNVAAGAVNATSMEAVNGSQLYSASQSLAAALGGGSEAGTDGTVSAPSYSLAGGTTTVNSVGAAIGNLDGRVTVNTGDISTLKDTIANSGLIDPTTGHAVAAVRYDRNEDGSPNRASVTLGDADTAVGLHNVATGVVSATSTDAVNGSQLHGMAMSVANAIGGDTTVDENGQVAVNSIEVGGHKYATISQAVQAAAAYGATDSLAVRYDVDSHGDPNYGSVTLGGPAAAPVMLTNVADGKSQYDAVNYGQLSSLQSDFENRLGSMDDRVSKIETTGGGSGGDARRTVSDDLISGSGDAGQTVTAAKSGNGSNNVAIGSGSTISDDIGNATAVGANSTVRAAGGTAIGAGADAHAANSTAIGQDSSARGENSTAIGQGSKARGDNSVAIGAGSVANEDNTVSFGDGSDQGKRRIVNIADGVNASDAATKGQLDRAVGGLQGQINGVSRNAYSGIAAATALTMIPGVDPGKTLSFGIGSASYKGYQAVAFGGEARINKNLKMKAGVGLSSGGNTVGLGASYQW
ncbi:YadA-like family protein [Burkholderia metallica]